MDAEERIGIQNTIGQGHPPAEEIHCYEPEACKTGGARGYRIIAYTGIGAIIGTAAAIALVLTKLAALPVAAPVVTGFAVAGLLYGWHESINLRKLRHLLADSRKNAVQKIYSIESKEHSDPAPIITVVYPSDMADFPASDTYPRDKLAGAKLALLNLDPAKTVRQ